MADKRRYNSKLNAKGLEASVSEDQAGGMCRHQGSRYVFIIEAHAGPKMVEEDGSETVSLIPDLVELVPAEQEERVRTFMRALYLARPEQFGQAAFEGANPGEIPLAAAGDQLDAAVERDDTGKPTGVWDGDPDAAPGTEQCDYPGCILDAEHDGDHDVAEEEQGGSVVAFSGTKGSKG
jgi:hypothetical protein